MGRNISAERGRSVMRRAEAWRENNPRAWAYIVAQARAEVDTGRPFGVRELIERARFKDFASVDGGRYAINNDYSPVFARWIAAEVEGAAPLIRTRRADVDAAEPAGVV